MSEVSAVKTVKDFVATDFRTAAIFEKHSIDFCCGGKKSLQTACAEAGADEAEVTKELEALMLAQNTDRMNFAEWELDTLAGFIVDHHHRYVRNAIPVLLAHTAKIVSVHGSRHPELAGIADRFHDIADELTGHMAKEERILFPYITSLAAAKRQNLPVTPPPFGTIQNPIRMMEAEHESAGDGLAFIRKASNGFLVPPDACSTFRVTYGELEEFERDLHTHVHLENNILFPKSIELERALLAKH